MEDIQKKLQESVNRLFPQVLDFWGIRTSHDPPEVEITRSVESMGFDTKSGKIIINEYMAKELQYSPSQIKIRSLYVGLAEEITHALRWWLKGYKTRGDTDIHAEEFLGSLAENYFQRKLGLKVIKNRYKERKDFIKEYEKYHLGELLKVEKRMLEEHEKPYKLAEKYSGRIEKMSKDERRMLFYLEPEDIKNKFFGYKKSSKITSKVIILLAATLTSSFVLFKSETTSAFVSINSISSSVLVFSTVLILLIMILLFRRKR